MKIYAIRDRLIDYFMVPFAAPDDKTVMAAIAKTINMGTNNEDIAKAPHHFEIWTLAEIKEDGHIEAEKYRVCGCAELIRSNIREGHRPGNAEATGSPGGTAPEDHRADSGLVSDPNTH